MLNRSIKSIIGVILGTTVLSMTVFMNSLKTTAKDQGQNFLIDLEYDAIQNENLRAGEEPIEPCGIAITIEYDGGEPEFTLYNGRSVMGDLDFADIVKEPGKKTYYIPTAEGRFTYDLDKNTSKNIEISVDVWECPVEIKYPEIRQINDNIIVSASIVTSHIQDCFNYSFTIINAKDTSDYRVMFDSSYDPTSPSAKKDIAIIIPVHPEGKVDFPINGKYIPQLVVRKIDSAGTDINESEEVMDFYTWQKAVIVTTGDTITVSDQSQQSGKQEVSNTDYFTQGQYRDDVVNDTLSENAIPENEKDKIFLVPEGEKEGVTLSDQTASANLIENSDTGKADNKDNENKDSKKENDDKDNDGFGGFWNRYGSLLLCVFAGIMVAVMMVISKKNKK